MASRGLTAVSPGRRRALKWMIVPASGLAVPAAFANAGQVGSARVWPAQEYTRVIVESSAPIPHQVLALRNPDRLVLDLEGIELSAELMQLPARVQPSDPYIAGVRLGRKSAGVVRVVFDLKAEVKPEVPSC